MQTNPNMYPSASACLMNTLREEGFLSLYKGLAAPFIGQFFQNALIFAGESVALRYLEPNMNFHSEMSNKTVMNVFIAGSFGGLVQCAVLVPADLIKCKMQVDESRKGKKGKYNGSLDCIAQVVKKKGPFGLFKGFGITALR